MGGKFFFFYSPPVPTKSWLSIICVSSQPAMCVCTSNRANGPIGLRGWQGGEGRRGSEGEKVACGESLGPRVRGWGPGRNKGGEGSGAGDASACCCCCCVNKGGEGSGGQECFLLLYVVGSAFLL